MPRRRTAKLLAQLAVASALVAACSIVGGIKDDYHTVGDASGSGGGSGSGGTGGTAGTDGGADGGAGADAGGAGGASQKLGAKCTSDADCGGLTCVKATSNAFGSGGPSHGYCTQSCQSTPQCDAISSGAQCVDEGAGNKFCMLGCDPTAQDSCRKRLDLVCLNPREGTDAALPPFFCKPQCVTNSDCQGRVCNLATGLCSDSQTPGLPVGSDCDPQASSNSCPGVCVGFLGVSGGVCSFFCNSLSLGILGACGSSAQPGSSQDAACLFSGGSGTTGTCAQLCSCDNDCRTSGFVCESWATAGFSAVQVPQVTAAFHQAGFCVPQNADGGTIKGIPSCPADGGVN